MRSKSVENNLPKTKKGRLMIIPYIKGILGGYKRKKRGVVEGRLLHFE